MRSECVACRSTLMAWIFWPLRTRFWSSNANCGLEPGRWEVLRVADPGQGNSGTAGQGPGAKCGNGSGWAARKLLCVPAGPVPPGFARLGARRSVTPVHVGSAPPRHLVSRGRSAVDTAHNRPIRITKGRAVRSRSPRLFPMLRAYARLRLSTAHSMSGISFREGSVKCGMNLLNASHSGHVCASSRRDGLPSW